MEVSLSLLEPYDRFQWKVHCPVCGDECVEQDEPGPRSTGPTSVIVCPDADEYEPGNPLGTRGGYTLIQLFCASGHGFDLVTANHKGMQIMGLIPAGPRWYPGDDPDEDKLDEPARGGRGCLHDTCGYVCTSTRS